MSRFRLDASEFTRLAEWATKIPEKSEEAINRALHSGDAAQTLQDEIDERISPSGRSWKGKSGSAKGAAWARWDNENLAVIVRTRPKYHYLYFPDDGTTTRRHIGQQMFFERGGKMAAPKIIDMCINEIKKELV